MEQLRFRWLLGGDCRHPSKACLACRPGPWVYSEGRNCSVPRRKSHAGACVRGASVPPHVTSAWPAHGHEVATDDAGQELIPLQHRVKKLKIAQTRSCAPRSF